MTRGGGGLKGAGADINEPSWTTAEPGIREQRRCGARPAADDCDDTDATIHPGAVDIPDDGIDQDCDGAIDEATDDTGQDTDHDTDQDTEAGCGCASTSGGGAGWMAALVGLMAVRRRRGRLAA